VERSKVAGRGGVTEMAGIPAKCLDCGHNLYYDGGRNMYFCPECEAKNAETKTVEELKKAA